MPAQKSILVVDDEPNLRRSLALIFQRAGYMVSTAGNAAEALQLLQAGFFDLTFLDLHLPDIDGIILLPKIRSLCPEMPVIILTGNSMNPSGDELRKLGMREYLLKPIDPSSLLARVQALLSPEQTH